MRCTTTSVSLVLNVCASKSSVYAVTFYAYTYTYVFHVSLFFLVRIVTYRGLCLRGTRFLFLCFYLVRACDIRLSRKDTVYSGTGLQLRKDFYTYTAMYAQLIFVWLICLNLQKKLTRKGALCYYFAYVGVCYRSCFNMGVYFSSGGVKHLPDLCKHLSL